MMITAAILFDRTWRLTFVIVLQLEISTTRTKVLFRQTDGTEHAIADIFGHYVLFALSNIALRRSNHHVYRAIRRDRCIPLHLWTNCCYIIR